jgi:hypothetical protein
LLPGALIDAGEEIGHRAVDLHALVAALLHQSFAAAKLRMRGNALVHVTLHARQRDVDEIVRRMVRAHHPFESVAADAAQQRVLLLVAAGEARQPFPVGELRGKIFGLAQLEILLRRLLRGHVHIGRLLEIVADRANSQGICAGLELGGRETVGAVGVAHDGDGDGRVGLLGADQHALHRPFLGRGDLSAERHRALRAGRRDMGRRENNKGCNGGRENVFHASCFLPENWFFFPGGRVAMHISLFLDGQFNWGNNDCRAGHPCAKRGRKQRCNGNAASFALGFRSSGDHAGKEQGSECKPCRAALQRASDLWHPGPNLSLVPHISVVVPAQAGTQYSRGLCVRHNGSPLARGRRPFIWLKTRHHFDASGTTSKRPAIPRRRIPPAPG